MHKVFLISLMILISAGCEKSQKTSVSENSKVSSAINDNNVVAFVASNFEVASNLNYEYLVVNQPFELTIRGNFMTADGDFKFLHSYTKTQLPNKLRNVFILCMSSIGIGKLANEATAIVKANKFMLTGVSPNGDEFRISADKCEITNPE